ncbi:MAG: class II aldolase/adducin family protein [Chloroflexi bacterium]|nr:class II aldolase/adducin family protein [Chloroflexota bacterium]
MVSGEIALRRELIETARHAEDIGLVIYSQGNFSLKLPHSGSILITPTGIPYRRLEPDDLVVLDLDGNKLSGKYEPSSETPVHLLAYQQMPDIGGAVHIEPPYINALAAVNLNPPPILGNFVYLFGGKGLAMVESIRSGNAAFARATMEAMQDHFGVIWKNHGIFCVGSSLELAYRRSWAAEQAAKVYYLSRALGKCDPEMISGPVQEEMIDMARNWGWI